jgi:cell division protein ZapA (FtsZ GTPase activity inhibitor)
MGAEKKSVTLTIRGRKYPLRTDADSQRLDQVVEFVNSRLDELDAHSGGPSGVGITDVRLVMLALLNVADDYLSCQQSLTEIKERADILNAELSPLLHKETEQLTFSDVI